MYMPSTDTDGQRSGQTLIGLLVSAERVGQNIKHTFS